ncbi:MAG: hypothetical protein UV57_C0048G0002 [Parcubacteria group bacterium GW2011_GWD2_43_10]|uniref:Thioredoxin-like fold domain-containing protein n=2 Tax=Candidatus Vebleniibacteriota TaxID=1817921 RepID=A0A1G2Q4F4_9BACT|nr:MAG: hypothetical protein UV52_C0030G0006 [Parcubacteria group bacterium GW2011_GWD1_42_9]KKS81271.1 MAG: hypothetical protein UV57_C0048G0002 [Parcubacteria group bacterium GW2011_GWD2_43_10]KKS92010.1 MAG: hypothetical protein UV69_C0040G0002 [Parcubacteria group bacterium GW2011_GWE2_43_12]KKT22404.1 MAG: hypothetical protein UW06_C0011G0010 [Parcubacteria group bacterium GW2011_GWE1_43_8]OHA54721.1 MAG: hypothetical protein A2388_01095 [Candidatus Veblenbacteria bacterium RIFOXYB1_FULL_4
MNQPNEGIELLYTRDCQAWPEAYENLKTALQELGITDEPQLVVMDTMDQAEEYNFFASPSIHIDGVDIDPHARRTGKRGLGTGRPYFADGRALVAPAINMIKQALEELYLTPEKSN